MDTNFISTPNDFRRIEGSDTFDFEKTFDLNGSQNDLLLRHYLRSAGLSDQIECLTAEQRRAFIYDIIKSNKMPGYWIPSTMQNSTFQTQRPSVRPPPPPVRMSPSPNPSSCYQTMRSTSSNSSLQSLDKSSPILPQRFIPAPVTPPLPTTFISGAKGIQYEISGPMDFRHTAGDMTRDRTRNAFDLSISSNDNVLRKYMIERGITEDDVAGMRKTDLIRKIVQSKFTWVPPKKQNKQKSPLNVEPQTPESIIEQKIVYATVSRTNGLKIAPNSQSSEEFIKANQNTPRSSRTSGTFPRLKSERSNYVLVTSRFADSTAFPSPNEIFDSKPKTNGNNETVRPPPISQENKRPPPPPRKTQYQRPIGQPLKQAPPPPPFTKPQSTQSQHKSKFYLSRNESDYDQLFETIPIDHSVAKPQHLTEPLYVTTAQQQARNKVSGNLPPQPIFNKPTLLSSSNQAPASAIPPPPPPPPPMPSDTNVARSTDKRASAGVAAMLSPSPPPPPPPMQNCGIIPPPPPPMSNNRNMSQPQLQTPVAPNKNASNSGGDDRDALLESIRKGIALKKVDQKAATISGVKPRNEHKPAAKDFLSELKLGITLRRVKSPEDNPFSDEFDESNA